MIDLIILIISCYKMNYYVEMGNALYIFYKPAILLMKLEYPTSFSAQFGEL